MHSTRVLPISMDGSIKEELYCGKRKCIKVILHHFKEKHREVGHADITSLCLSSSLYRTLRIIIIQTCTHHNMFLFYQEIRS